MSAREEVLTQIRTALGPHRTPPRVPRDYAGTTGVTGTAADVDLLAQRLVDYRARVHRVPVRHLASTVAAVLADHAVRRLVVPPGAPGDWLADVEGVEVLRDDPPLSLQQLDDADAVLTGCRVAVADTGTIVLDTGADQGRRAITLVPDQHVCVVRADQVVHGLPDGLARVDPLRPLTLISGPSATSDIELDRVEGVHGPRTLVVILAEPS